MSEAKPPTTNAFTFEKVRPKNWRELTADDLLRLDLSPNSVHQETRAETIAFHRGRLFESMSLLLSRGRARFGEPSEAISKEITGIGWIWDLLELHDRVLRFDSWEEVMAKRHAGPV